MGWIKNFLLQLFQPLENISSSKFDPCEQDESFVQEFESKLQKCTPPLDQDNEEIYPKKREKETFNFRKLVKNVRDSIMGIS
jgi:hypothetical protein